MNKEYKWDDEIRLEMIDRSKNYENPKEYQYGYFDGYQKYFRESKENPFRVPGWQTVIWV